MSGPQINLKDMSPRQKELYARIMKEYQKNPPSSIIGKDGMIDLAMASKQAKQEVVLREMYEERKANEYSTLVLNEKKEIKKDAGYSMKDYLGKSLGEMDNTFFNTELGKYANKIAISKVAQEYAGKTNDADIQKLLKNVSDYAGIVSSNADAIIKADVPDDKKIKEKLIMEAAAQKRIIKDAEKLFNKLQKKLDKAMEKVTPMEIDGKIVYETEEIRQLGDEIRMVTGIFEYFDALKTGGLEV